MQEILLRRLKAFAELSSDDVEKLNAAFAGKPRLIGARKQILRQGDVFRTIPFILRGWVCSCKHLEDGRWQMLSLFLPGDLCDYGLPALEEADHSLRTVTDAIVIDVSHDELEELGFSNPRIAKALRWSSLVQSSIAREWVLTLGQRTARERCAHLICEVFWRLRGVGLTKGNTIEFPLTQEEIGGAVGVSTVHANRMLQDLRSARLIEQEGRRLTIVDLHGLENLALFNPAFLHLPGTRRRSLIFGGRPSDAYQTPFSRDFHPTR